MGAIDSKTMREFESLSKGAKPKKREVGQPRVVWAPAPALPARAPLPPNLVLSVVLQPGEEALRTWSTDAKGGSYVSGYTIVRSSTLVVTRKSAEEILKQIRSAKPIKALRELMREDVADHSKVTRYRRRGRA